ncbi:MAG: alpha/beta fold hydrolase [Marinibacterium sp.]
MPRVEINGTKLHYQQIGQGPHMLLIHGLFSNIAFWWAHVAPALARTHRVTALDLRGHGLSGMTERGYRAVDLADDVSALMDHLRMEDVHVVAHSFGGAIALAAALRDHDRVSRMTLAEAWVPSLQPDIATPNVRKWPRLRETLRARGLSDEDDLPMVAMAFLEELAETPDAAFSRATRTGARAAWMPVSRNSRGVVRWRRLMETTHAWREFYKTDDIDASALATLDVPVNLIYGARSGYLRSRDGLVRHLPDVTSQETPGGHYFPIIHPQALTDSVMTMARRQRLAGPGRAVG